MTTTRVTDSAIVTRIRANPLEALLLAVATLAILFAMVKTVTVASSGDRTQDLTFAGTTTELGKTLSANGTSRIGHLERANVVVGTDTVVADTIVITADSASEPAFAAGGFLRDQVTLYNDDAIRQALLTARDGSRPVRGRSEGRSLFRTAWNDDGSRMLSDRPSPYGLAIRSPYAEGAWRDVRTTDWRSSPGLLGYDGEVSLPAERASGVFTARLNGRDCNVSRATPQYYMYCQSMIGADVNRFYDFGFEVRPGANGGSFGNAGPYRQRSVWMNGHAETLGQRHVSGGDIFEVQALGPFMLSAADWGTLAAEQWINGRRLFANPRLGTLSFFAPAGRTSAGGGPLTLSFDASLSMDLDRESRRFMTAHDGLLSQLAVVVLDARTGEVKAIAEPARQSDDEPLVSFEPILVGSVVKPLVASAILARHAGLAQMRVRYSGDTVRSVAGVPLHKGFANDANGCGADIGFTDFIRCSSNQYAAELLIQSLQEDGWTQRGRSTLVPRKALEQSAIATGLAEVFDVDAYANRTPGRLTSYWEVGTLGFAGPPNPVTTDRSLIPYESRPWILFPDSAGTPADLLARYAFGGWENRWTLLGLAEAYARIATGRNVQATFLHRPGTTAAYPFPEASPAVEGAFAQVRAGLRQVPVNGTAAGLADKLRAATKDTVIVLAKTGTLNEAAAGGKLKSLAMAVGRPAGSGQSAALRCGLVAITYFEFSDDRRAKAKRTALPRIHRDFAEGALAEVLGRHWGRVSGCAEPQVTSKPSLRVARR